MLTTVIVDGLKSVWSSETLFVPLSRAMFFIVLNLAAKVVIFNDFSKKNMALFLSLYPISILVFQGFRGCETLDIKIKTNQPENEKKRHSPP